MNICKFCGKECKSLKSVNAHQPVCKENPTGKTPSSWATGNRRGIPSWNSGLIDDVRCKLPESAKEKLSISTSSRTNEFNKENGKKISDTVNKKVEDGTWHTSLAKNMHIEYNGVNLHGTWELKYAEYLDENNIQWIRNKDSFTYEFENVKRRYTPDFYLPDTDEYIEIKGYRTDKDLSKWDQFPSDKKLKVLMKNELLSLGIKI